MTPPVLVVGGTGVLRPAVDVLRRRGPVLLAVRRPVPTPPDVLAVRADTAAASTTVAGPFAAAVVYAPAVHAAVLDRLARASLDAVVLVVPSALLADGGALAVRTAVARTGATPVLLGWTGPPDAPRWHEPREIAAAALRGLAERRPVVLGRLDGRRPD